MYWSACDAIRVHMNACECRWMYWSVCDGMWVHMKACECRWGNMSAYIKVDECEGVLAKVYRTVYTNMKVEWIYFKCLMNVLHTGNKFEFKWAKTSATFCFQFHCLAFGIFFINFYINSFLILYKSEITLMKENSQHDIFLCLVDHGHAQVQEW